MLVRPTRSRIARSYWTLVRRATCDVAGKPGVQLGVAPVPPLAIVPPLPTAPLPPVPPVVGPPPVVTVAPDPPVLVAPEPPVAPVELLPGVLSPVEGPTFPVQPAKSKVAISKP